MKKSTAFGIMIIMTIGFMAMCGFCIMHIMRNGFNMECLPTMAVIAIGSLGIAVKNLIR